jgi:hypothetical protein
VRELLRLFDSDDEGVRLAAVKEFMDRFAGKPVAQVEQDIRTTDVNEYIRQAYLQVMMNQPKPGDDAKVIDAEPTATALPGGNDGHHEW